MRGAFFGAVTRVAGSNEEAGSKGREVAQMANFSFKTNLIAVMRVRARDEMAARKVVPTALRGPSAVEIRLANEGTALLYEGAIVTNVDFSVEEDSIELIETARMSELSRKTTGSEL